MPALSLEIPAPVTQPFSREHAASGFQCEHEALNRFFRQEAGQNQDRDMSRTWVLRRPEDRSELPLVLGYYTLTVGAVSRETAPPEVTRRLPRYPLPAVIIGRLARDLRVRGQGYGEALLADAHLRALHINAQAGAVLIVVDAKDAHASRFYERFGYEPMLAAAAEAREWPRRMFLTMKTLRASLPVEE